MKVLIPAILILGLAFLGLAIRILLIKGGNFSKSCSSVETGDNESKTCECSLANNGDETSCKYYSVHHPQVK